ncbi:hypothetical protein BY996DRAFT_7263396 [Phakopsora pachyrhizi]|nr:hypothetical protein BY996DRAFT_7263396 [Phakopsora pachyrhizi]
MKSLKIIPCAILALLEIFLINGKFPSSKDLNQSPNYLDLLGTTQTRPLGEDGVYLQLKGQSSSFKINNDELFFLPASKFSDPKIGTIDFINTNKEPGKRPLDEYLGTRDQQQNAWNKKQKQLYSKEELAWVFHGKAGDNYDVPLRDLPSLELSLGWDSQHKKSQGNSHPATRNHEFTFIDNHPWRIPDSEAQTSESNNHPLEGLAANSNSKQKHLKETAKSSSLIASGNNPIMKPSGAEEFLYSEPVGLNPDRNNIQEFPQSSYEVPSNTRSGQQDDTVDNQPKESSSNAVRSSTISSIEPNQEVKKTQESSKSNLVENIGWSPNSWMIRKSRSQSLRRKRLLLKSFEQLSHAQSSNRELYKNNDDYILHLGENNFDRHKERSVLRARKKGPYNLDESKKLAEKLVKKKKKALEREFQKFIASIKTRFKRLEESASNDINPLRIFLDDIDKFAENLPSNLVSKVDVDNNLIPKKQYVKEKNKLEAEVDYSSPSNMLERSLDHKNFQLDNSFFVELGRKFKTTQYKRGFRRSIKMFLDTVGHQIKQNRRHDYDRDVNGSNEFLYISKGQINDFFVGRFERGYRIEWPFRIKGENHKTLYYFSKVIIKAMDHISSWRQIFLKDLRNESVERGHLILYDRWYPGWSKNYSNSIRLRFCLRRLFLVYSTIINKIFCEGPEDLQASFLIRQSEAIEFYDQLWKLFRIKSYNNRKSDFTLLIINNDQLPIPEHLRSGFLSTYDIKHSTARKTDAFEIRTNISQFGHLKRSIWSFIAIWLASKRFDLYHLMYSTEDKVINRMKTFINILICAIIYN